MGAGSSQNIDYQSQLKSKNTVCSIFSDCLPIINNQKKNSVCKIIKNNGEAGTGFLCKIPHPDSFNLKPTLITCYHVLRNEDLIEGKKIVMKFNDDEKEKCIIIDKERKIYTSNEKEFDITIIEIKSSDNFNKEDFLDVDDYLYKGDILNDIYQEQKNIYLIHYSKGFKAKLSFGTIKNISLDNNEIKHLSDTDEGSSGCPIFNLSNYKIIGIHKGDHKKFEFQVGTILKNPIVSFNSNKKNKFNLNLELIYNIIIRFYNEDSSSLYKKLKFLGEGSFASSYICQNRITDSIRALRVSSYSRSLNLDEEKEIKNSANILKSLDHPNIVKIFEAFNSKESFSIVNELCNGGELFQEIIDNGPFNENYSAYVMFQLISAINYLHNNNIIHRDLKSEHIVISNRNKDNYPTIKVIGFNCSTKFKKGELQRKLTGSSYYIAPEIFKKNIMKNVIYILAEIYYTYY